MSFIPNWEKHKNPLTNKPFKSKEEALASAGVCVAKEGYNIMTGDGEVFEYRKK